jgi:hypothetical protein
MATITDLQQPAEIHGPDDPELAKLWALALAKFEARAGHQPETRDDWHMVTKIYGRLVRKPHGSLGQILQERCEEVPGGD